VYPGSKLPFIAYGWSLGGAIGLAVDRHLPENDRFDAHLLVEANMGQGLEQKPTDEKVNEMRKLAASNPSFELFSAPRNPALYL
jgi:hypothetical protein